MLFALFASLSLFLFSSLSFAGDATKVVSGSIKYSIDDNTGLPEKATGTGYLLNTGKMLVVKSIDDFDKDEFTNYVYVVYDGCYDIIYKEIIKGMDVVGNRYCVESVNNGVIAGTWSKLRHDGTSYIWGRYTVSSLDQHSLKIEAQHVAISNWKGTTEILIK